MDIAILKLADIGRGDAARAGGKAANLGEMARAGFPVPAGFVIPAAVYREFLHRQNLDSLIAGVNTSAAGERERRCRSLRRRIEAAELPVHLAQAILAAHAELAHGRAPAPLCVVRSSATAEDSPESSFAGQHETYYYVDGDRLLTMVKCCWSSLFSPAAVAYRVARGLGGAELAMAVIVQEMIPAGVAGVTFTVNPLTGDAGEIVTESSWGMGAAVVDGRVTPDRYVLARAGLVLKEKRVAEKKLMVMPHPAVPGRGRLEEVPPQLRPRETLSPEEARTISGWALRAEELFGGPQDVEWALADGRFYLLQSRPVTAAGRLDIIAGVTGEYVIFKSLFEKFTDPLTPLTADLIALILGPPLVRLVRGWPYLSFRHLKALMPFRASDEELARLLYGLEVPRAGLKVSWRKVPFVLAVLFGVYLVCGVHFARSGRMPLGFMGKFREQAARTAADGSLGPYDAVARLYPWTSYWEPIGEQVLFVNLMSVRYIFRMALLKEFLRRWLPELGGEAVALLCSGAEGVLSAEMGRDIWRLAKDVRGMEAVRRILEAEPPELALSALSAEPQAEAFLVHLRHFLAVHGHRALKESELAADRWEEDPSPVLAMVRNYLLGDADPEEHERQVESDRRALDADIRRRLERCLFERPLRIRYHLVKFLAARAQYFSRQRENSRFYMALAFAAVRRCILRREGELIAAGKLTCKGDVFFLHLAEVENLQAGRLQWPAVEERIRLRRLDHIRLSRMTPPRTIGVAVPTSPASSEMQETGEGEVLRGQAASPGTYEGVARVILDPAVSMELAPGEVLVAPYTDPSWTPLFLTAGAAVIEVGSYLSHAGTVAREFGMPCVVDVPECTRRIRSGARVRVDGSRGLVHLLAAGGGER